MEDIRIGQAQSTGNRKGEVMRFAAMKCRSDIAESEKPSGLPLIDLLRVPDAPIARQKSSHEGADQIYQRSAFPASAPIPRVLCCARRPFWTSRRALLCPGWYLLSAIPPKLLR